MTAEAFYNSKSLAEKIKLGWIDLDGNNTNWFLIMEAYAKQETKRANAYEQAWTVARAKILDFERQNKQENKVCEHQPKDIYWNGSIKLCYGCGKRVTNKNG